MENLVIFSLNALAIMAIWFFCFKPAVKSRKQLELHLLKNEIDQFFLSNSKFSHSKIMRAKLLEVVADTENTLDHVSLSAYIAWTIEVEQNKNLREALDKEIDEKFFAKDEDLKGFISHVRSQSSMIGISYMIESSFFLLAFGVLISISMFIKDLFKKGSITFKDFKMDFESTSEKIFKSDFIEQKSFFNTKIC
jgi:hypothetical protein